MDRNCELAAVVAGIARRELQAADLASRGVMLDEADELGLNELAVVLVIKAVGHFEAAA